MPTWQAPCPEASHVKAIDALKQSGVTEAEVGSLIIKPRTLSHRRASTEEG